MNTQKPVAPTVNKLVLYTNPGSWTVHFVGALFYGLIAACALYSLARDEITRLEPASQWLTLHVLLALVTLDFATVFLYCLDLSIPRKIVIDRTTHTVSVSRGLIPDMVIRKNTAYGQVDGLKVIERRKPFGQAPYEVVLVIRGAAVHILLGQFKYRTQAVEFAESRSESLGLYYIGVSTHPGTRARGSWIRDNRITLAAMIAAAILIVIVPPAIRYQNEYMAQRHAIDIANGFVNDVETGRTTAALKACYEVDDSLLARYAPIIKASPQPLQQIGSAYLDEPLGHDRIEVTYSGRWNSRKFKVMMIDAGYDWSVLGVYRVP